MLISAFGDSQRHRDIYQEHFGLTCAPLSSSARHFSHADTPDSNNGAGGVDEMSGFGCDDVVVNEADEYVADDRSRSRRRERSVGSRRGG